MKKKDAIKAVSDYLDTEGWHYKLYDDSGIIIMSMKLHCRLHCVTMVVDFDEDSYTVYAVSPVNADMKRPAEIMKFISAVNYGLKNGNFELDTEDGEIRYKCYVSFDLAGSLHSGIIERSLVIPPCMYELYGDGIAALSLGLSDSETELSRLSRRY